MDQQILVFSGNKQAGKSTAAKFVSGLFLQRAGVIKRFEIVDDDLVVNTINMDDQGKEFEGEGILDLYSHDENLLNYAAQRIWPHVKIYSFAEPLKNFSINVMGLKPECVYGTDEQKNEPTHIKWKDMCRFLPSMRVKQIKDEGKYDKFMTHREFLEVFGTDVCRHLHDPCWLDTTLNRVIGEGSALAVIDDARFENEIKGSSKIGAKVIRLKNTKYPGGHKSNTALDKWTDDKFDAVIDTDTTTLKEKNFAIIDHLKEWGWLD